jgi:sugar O-acyltransferase (sialic acid O-acetyltransferase NeuD family)
MGYSVIGNDDDIPKFIEQGYSFLVTMGHMGKAERRNLLFDKIKSLDGKLPVIKAPSAFVSKRAKIQDGTIIMHQCIINADSSIGNNCIINNKALVEHDSSIGNHCHISTGAIVNGDCSIGNESFIGSGTVIKNGISISNNIIIGAGSLVIKDIENSGIYIGSPVTKTN